MRRKRERQSTTGATSISSSSCSTSSMMATAVLLVLLPNKIPIHVQGYMPQEDNFEAPSLRMRGAIKEALERDCEDVMVMQQELHWGAQEMKRYKTLRGEWPVREAAEQSSSSAVAVPPRDSSAIPDSKKKKNKRQEENSNNSSSSNNKNNQENNNFDLFGGDLIGEDGEIDVWDYLVSIF